MKLTEEQKETLKGLASKNISVKLELQTQRNKLVAGKDSDKAKLIDISRAIAYQHQEENKYLKEVLSSAQYELYREHQNNKKRRRR